MSLINETRLAVYTCFSKFITFSGRASRREFWLFFLFDFVVYLALLFVTSGSNDTTGFLLGCWLIIVFLPFISVSVRRLHDINFNGWWVWSVLIPLLGFLKKGDNGRNKYGADPYAKYRYNKNPAHTTEKGLTLLHVAASICGKPEVITALIRHGTDVKVRTKDGKFAIDLIPKDSKIRNSKVYWQLNDAKFD